MTGRVLFLLLIIVENGAAVGWVGIVLGWAARQSRTDTTVPLPRNLYIVGLPLLAAAAIIVHMAVDPTTPGVWWWIPVAWCVLAVAMLRVHRIQCSGGHRRRL
jgi:phosphatidylserine synthase